MATSRAALSISVEARGRTRQLLRDLEASGSEMRRRLARVPGKLLCGQDWKGLTGARRAMDRIVAIVGQPPDLRNPKFLIYRFLDVIETVPGDPPEASQRCIVVRGLVAGSKFPRQGGDLFGCAATGHAVGRLFERSGFNADPVQAILAAHDALLCLQPAEVSQIFALSEVVLPAAGGVWLARPRIVGAHASPLTICRTWVPRDQLHAQQEASLAAWAQLLDPMPDVLRD
jgi:hypothetical protein